MTNFSIIIPVHNRAHTLESCVNSILSQTYSNFELILVDDHSTDNSLEIANKFTDQDSRVKVIEQVAEKKGAQAARNTGIKSAKYDWIMFNDSDDIWCPNKIQLELNVLEQNKFDDRIVIYSDCNTVNIKTGERKYWKLPVISREESYKDLLIKSAPMFQSILCSKKHIQEICYLDESVPSYQEWDTSIRLAKNGFFVHISEPLFDYYVGANDAISKSAEKDFIGRCNIYNKFKDDIIYFHGKKQFREMILKNLISGENLRFFEKSKDINPILAKYNENLVCLFGNKYKTCVSKYMNKTERKNRIYNVTKKIITKPYKIPVWLFRKFFLTKTETYQQKITKHIKFYASKVYFGQDGNDRLLELLSQNKPVFITRFGSVELNSLNENLRGKGYSDYSYSAMRNNTGFFPVTKENLDKFSAIYFDAIKNIDACGVWFNDGEGQILKQNVPNALLVELSCLNSFLFKNPYTQIFKYKTILVVHPFVNSIEHQLKKRDFLFSDKDVLPECEIKIIKAPQTIAGNTDGYASWFEALEATKKKIDKEEFDIAVIGCGTYGLPLGAYIKSKGKIAIHMGGATQLLFGIKGKRWESEYDYDKRVFNENWIYPLESDTPPNSVLVENNCYWK